MKQNPALEAVDRSASQEIDHLPFNPEIQHYVQNSLPEPYELGPHPQTHFFLISTSTLSSHLPLGLSSGVFPFGFTTNILCAFPIFFVYI